jgi:hypothetical protein
MRCGGSVRTDVQLIDTYGALSVMHQMAQDRWIAMDLVVEL